MLLKILNHHWQVSIPVRMPQHSRYASSEMLPNINFVACLQLLNKNNLWINCLLMPTEICLSAAWATVCLFAVVIGPSIQTRWAGCCFNNKEMTSGDQIDGKKSFNSGMDEATQWNCSNWTKFLQRKQSEHIRLYSKACSSKSLEPEQGTSSTGGWLGEEASTTQWLSTLEVSNASTSLWLQNSSIIWQREFIALSSISLVTFLCKISVAVDLIGLARVRIPPHPPTCGQI